MPHIRLLSDSVGVHVAVTGQAGWEAVAPMPTRVQVQLEELADELHVWRRHTFPVPMTQPRDMYSDTLDLAWGGVLHGDSQAAFGCFLNRQEHMNVRERRTHTNRALQPRRQ